MVILGVFPGAFLHAQENQTQLKVIKEFEHLMALLVFMSNTGNLSCFVSFFQPGDPVYRFFVDYLGIQPKFNMIFIPFAGAEVWFAAMLAHTTAVVISSCAVQVASAELWMGSLGSILETQQWPRLMDKQLQGRAYLRFYKCHQILAGLGFSCTASVLLSVHHLGLLVALIICNYAILRPATDYDALAFKIFACCCWPCGFAIIFYEIEFVAKFSTTTDGFLRKCKNYFRTSAFLRKSFRACNNIRVYSSYPFFTITRRTFFVKYVHEIFEQTINLLVMMGFK